MSVGEKVIGTACLITILLLQYSVVCGKPRGKADVRVALTGNVVTWVDPASVRAASEPLIDMIAKRVKRSYSFSTVSGGIELLARLKTGKINYAFGSLQDYVEIADEIKVVPVVKARAMGSDTFRIQLLVRRGSGITRIDQLRGKTISIFERESIYRIYLDVLLAKNKIKSPEEFFSTTRKKKKLNSVVLDLLLGEADACIASDQMVRAMAKLNPRITKKLVVLNASKPFPNPPMFALTSVDRRLFQQVKQVAIDLHKSQNGRQLLLMFKTERMVPAKDSDYDSFRELLKAYKRLQAKKP